MDGVYFARWHIQQIHINILLQLYSSQLAKTKSFINSPLAVLLASPQQQLLGEMSGADAAKSSAVFIYSVCLLLGPGQCTYS